MSENVENFFGSVNMNQPKKKVLIFLQSRVGGAERVSVTIGKILNLRKFDVSFCSVGNCENSIAEFIPAEYERDQIKTDHPFRQLYKFYKKIKQNRPDIVFSSVVNINTKLLLLKPFFPDVKFVIRSDNNYDYFSKKHRLMIRLIYQIADTIVAQTQEMKDGLVCGAKITERKIVVLQNPVDVDYIDEKVKNAISPYEENGNKKIVASGRFADSKGFDILIESFNILKKENTNVELFIIGRTGGEDNPVYQKLQHLIKMYKLENCVHCLGYQNNPYPYVKYADCFVLSSRKEGLPNVLLESLYLHTPVAATKCIPIINRLVDEGKNGFCAEIENPSSLALAINNCLKIKFVEKERFVTDTVKIDNIFGA